MTPAQRAIAQIECGKLAQKLVGFIIDFEPCAELQVRTVQDIARFARNYAFEAIEAVIDGETQ